jgi:hypothetical protein
MRAPQFVLRGGLLVCGRGCGMRPFRRGFCVVIVAMRRKGQQLERRSCLSLHSQKWLCNSSSAFAALEKFYLFEPLLGFFLGFVGTTEILLAVFRQNFVATNNLLNHLAPLGFDAGRGCKSCDTLRLDNAAYAP